MSACELEESMDFSDCPSTSLQNSDIVRVTISVKCPVGEKPEKSKRELQKALQSWANTHGRIHSYTVLNVSEDWRAEVKVEPAPAVRYLQELIGLTLPRKEGKTFTITSVSLTPPGMEIPEDSSVDSPAQFGSVLQHTLLQDDEVQVILSVKWSMGTPPYKSKIVLQKTLQTWANTHENLSKDATDCTVLMVSEDGRAAVRIRPPPAVRDLQELCGTILPDKNGWAVTVTSISLT